MLRKRNVLVIGITSQVCLIKLVSRFRKKPKLDFRSPSDTSDVTLKIKDVDFYVHKQASI